MKLEIKHLASYLPYGLKLKTEYGWCIMLTLNDWSVNGDCDESLCYETKDTTDFKPILRPLSDLTKEIEVNGEKFVPIEWLFYNLIEKSDIVQFEWKFKEDIKPIFQIDDEWNHCVTFINHFQHELCFSFDSNTNSFMLGMLWDTSFGVEWFNISNQYAMFNKLFEWHFDVFGLLENNLAIDINTLK